MRNFLEHIRNSPSFESLLSRLDERLPLTTLGQMPSSLVAVVAALTHERSMRPVLVVCAGPSPAESMYADLTALLGEGQVGMLPPLKQHPFDTAPLASGPRNERTDALLRLSSGSSYVLVAPVEALLEITPSANWMKQNTLRLAVGDDYPRALLISNMHEAGYQREAVIDTQGQFAIRGGLLDLFPVGHENPVRIEFDGDQIASMRTFDPSTQRTESVLKELNLLVGDDAQTSGSGIFDIVSDSTLLIWNDQPSVKERVTQFLGRAESLYGHAAGKHREAPWLLYRSFDEVLARTESLSQLTTGGLQTSKKNDLVFRARNVDPYVKGIVSLGAYIGKYVKKGEEVWITAENQGERQRIDEILAEEGLDTVATIAPTFSTGFILTSAHLVVLTGHELLGRRRIATHRARFRRKVVSFDRASLRGGDLVVHAVYGVGKYEGMQTVKVRNQPMECLRIVYQDDVVLYVHVDQYSLVEKYIGAEGSKPRLSRIGTTDWSRTKARTKKALADIAGELIRLYSERKIAKGHAFPPDSHWQREMESSFEFVDTPDQARATEEVKTDLESESPMDRLLCGDVGFGKTEVAVRAAFKAVQDNYQAAVLVPTTILAQQHYETFRNRLASYPVQVEFLSRFHSPLDQKEIVAELKQGKIDIIIGTHRLLSKDVEFKRLGLVVIDEEHRFGVKHKERLKQMRTNVDVLTMTATPIPRTLHLALMGARDTSQINTPPIDRLPINTEVHAWSEELIRDALLQEVDRQGQAFFLHNRVESIHGIKGMVDRLVPGIRSVVAHGQMPEGHLEKVMIDFLNQRYDVLICTTIIESGIDIPNANTLIVNRADKFGLAQLYQLRGRIGRSSRQAYAYLLTPPRMEITGHARKRLATLTELTELGSGMKIAMKDLEIRGAGNLLGAEQSGFINAVGFDLYTKLLEEAVLEIKGDKSRDLELGDEDIQIEYDGPALIPSEYIDEGDIRYDFYRRIASSTLMNEIDEISEELFDRFGPLPVETRNLIDILRLKIMCRRLSFTRLRLHDSYLQAGLALPGQPDEAQRIIGRLVSLADPEQVEFRMAAGVELLYRYPKGDSISQAKRFLQRLTREGILQG
jgi:transcription-repair coupling factor (superfamily II helicase)